MGQQDHIVSKKLDQDIQVQKTVTGKQTNKQTRHFLATPVEYRMCPPWWILDVLAGIIEGDTLRLSDYAHT